jgi:hypothetical protein
MEKKEVKKKVVKKDGALPLIKRARGEGYTTDNRSLSRRFNYSYGHRTPEAGLST